MHYKSLENFRVFFKFILDYRKFSRFVIFQLRQQKITMFLAYFSIRLGTNHLHFYKNNLIRPSTGPQTTRSCAFNFRAKRTFNFYKTYNRRRENLQCSIRISYFYFLSFTHTHTHARTQTEDSFLLLFYKPRVLVDSLFITTKSFQTSPAVIL